MRLLISEPHQLFRECLAAALGIDQRFSRIDRVEGTAEIETCLAQRAVDILLLGTEELNDELLEATRALVAVFPAVRILLLGREGHEQRIADFLQAGASGYLLRDQSLAEVAAALEAVGRGEKICPPRVMRLLFSRLGELGRERRRRERLDALHLSAREIEILRHIAEGRTNQEIALDLCLSVHTVKNHVHRILDALGVHTRWEAVQHAIANGWVCDRRRRI